MIHRIVVSSFLVIVALTTLSAATPGEKSDAKVKATASAKKSGADGKQVVTITLDVAEPWYIYANPINANSEVFKDNQTRVTIKAKNKVMSTVQYPKGKQKIDDKYKFDVYQGKVTIQANVQRTMGDASPLEVSIHINACRKGECLLPGVIKLMVK